MNKYKLILIIAIGSIGLSFTWPSKLEQKVNTTITKTFNLKQYKLDEIKVDPSIEKATLKQVSQCLFNITHEGKSHGYIYVGEAPSMKNVFDYAVAFSPDLEIINAKVLIYREKHGRQIGMKRWLKQFFGMTPEDEPTLGIQVDGISGATISATSMTDSVREVLSTIRYLRNHDKL